MILYVGLPPTLTFGPRSAFARLASSTLVLIALRLTNCQLNAVSLSTRNLDSVVAARLWIFLQTDCGLAKPHDTEGVCGAYLSGPVVRQARPWSFAFGTRDSTPIACRSFEKLRFLTFSFETGVWRSVFHARTPCKPGANKTNLGRPMSRKVISVDRASVSSVDGFVAEILEVVGRSAHWGRVASARLHHDFEAIARRDYERDLDAHFSKREMQALFMALEWTLPGLNREQFRPKPLAGAHALGVQARRKL